VTAFVNEHDRWYPLRAVLGATDPDGMRAGWTALGAAWAAGVERARRLPGADLHVSVNGEWSFVQTLRHLVFAMDKWFSAPVLGRPFDPIGLPNSGSADFPWPDLDPDAAPSVAEVLVARAEQATRFEDHLAAMTADDLTATIEVLENGPHLMRDCASTVLEEEFRHHRYAAGDLTELEARNAPVAILR
jgi:DinB superfamily